MKNNKKTYDEVLEEVASNENVDEEIRDEAKEELKTKLSRFKGILKRDEEVPYALKYLMPGLATSLALTLGINLPLILLEKVTRAGNILIAVAASVIGSSLPYIYNSVKVKFAKKKTKELQNSLANIEAAEQTFKENDDPVLE